MVAWLTRFFRYCLRAGRTIGAVVECDLRLVLRDRSGAATVVCVPAPVRREDTRPRLGVAVTCSEGLPVGLLRLLGVLERGSSGRIGGLQAARAGTAAGRAAAPPLCPQARIAG